MVKRNFLIALQVLLVGTGVNAMVPAARQAVLPAAKGLARYGVKPGANVLCSYDFNRSASTKPLAPTAVNLYRAVRDSDIAQVKDLLARGGADLGSQGILEETLINLARTDEVAEALIAAGADIEFKNEFGHTPLSSVVSSNRSQVIKPLLRAGVNMHAVDKYGFKLLQSAVILNNIEAARALLELGVDVETLDSHGIPSLHWAKTPEMANLLLEHGANLTAIAKHGETALDHALNRYGSNCYDKAKSIKMVDFFLDQGLDINAKNKNGETPLHQSVYNIDTVKALLARGADVKAADRYGNTALHQAVISANNVETVKALLNAGAKVDALDRWGQSPIDKARTHGNTDIVNLLVDTKLEDVADKLNMDELADEYRVELIRDAQDRSSDEIKLGYLTRLYNYFNSKLR